jgi:YesN/AraC family two-component response regulator
MLTETFLFDYDNLFHTLNTLQFLSALAIAGLLISPFFFPGILYGLPRLPESAIELQANAETRKISDDAKKMSPNFEADYMQLIELKAESCMKEQQPYLNTEFNLNQFSVLLQIPAHHVTFFFREVKKQSFSDFRNKFRVNHAKMLILEPKSANLTLEAIGLQSGFATRNTFFTAFKKTEGISPSAFATRTKQTLL